MAEFPLSFLNLFGDFIAMKYVRGITKFLDASTFVNYNFPSFPEISIVEENLPNRGTIIISVPNNDFFGGMSGFVIQIDIGTTSNCGFPVTDTFLGLRHATPPSYKLLPRVTVNINVSSMFMKSIDYRPDSFNQQLVVYGGDEYVAEEFTGYVRSFNKIRINDLYLYINDLSTIGLTVAQFVQIIGAFYVIRNGNLNNEVIDSILNSPLSHITDLQENDTSYSFNGILTGIEIVGSSIYPETQILTISPDDPLPVPVPYPILSYKKITPTKDFIDLKCGSEFGFVYCDNGFEATNNVVFLFIEPSLSSPCSLGFTYNNGECCPTG